jgi:hypothetical protein
MFYLSDNLKLIATFTDLNKIPKEAKKYNVTKAQCQSLIDKVEEDIAPYSFCNKQQTSILMYKSYE